MNISSLIKEASKQNPITKISDIDTFVKNKIIRKSGSAGAFNYTMVYETIPIVLALVGVNNYNSIDKLNSELKRINKNSDIDISQYGISAMIKICNKFGEDSIEYFIQYGGGAIELLNQIKKEKVDVIIHDRISEYYHNIPDKFIDAGDKQNTADTIFCFGDFKSVDEILSQLPKIKTSKIINGAKIEGGSLVQVSLKSSNTGKHRIGKIKTSWQKKIYGTDEDVSECLTYREAVDLVENSEISRKEIIVENVFDIVSMSLMAIKKTILSIAEKSVNTYKSLMSTIMALNKSAVSFFKEQEDAINSSQVVKIANELESLMIPPTKEQIESGEVILVGEKTDYSLLNKYFLTRDKSLLPLLNEAYGNSTDPIIMSKPLIEKCLQLIYANRNIYMEMSSKLELMNVKADIINKKSQNTIQLIGIASSAGKKELEAIKRDIEKTIEWYTMFFKREKATQFVNSSKPTKQIAISRSQIIPLFKLSANLEALQYCTDLLDWIDKNVDRSHTAREKAYELVSELAASAIY